MLRFHLCLSGPFSHTKPSQNKKGLGKKKADGLSLWLRMNLQKYVAAIVKESSVSRFKSEKQKKRGETESR